MQSDAEAWMYIGDLTGQHEPAWSKARSDAEKAVAIAPDLAEAHAALGLFALFCGLEIRRRLDELRRAKELSPSNPTANDLLARVIGYLGRLMRPSGRAARRWNSTHFQL